MRGRLRAALVERARDQLGADATALDYVEDYVSNGGMLSALAESLGVSRQFLSHCVHRLAPDATERLEAARRVGATSLVESAVTIADNAPDTATGVQRARLQVDIRKWVAERFDPKQFGNTKPDVSISFGQLHLDALRHYAAKRKAEESQLPASDGE